MSKVRALVLLTAALTATGCHGRARSATEWSSTKTAFAAGSVLRHAPEICAGGRLFLDLPRAEKNEATRVAVGVLGARMLGGAYATTGTRRVFGALRDALRDEGVDLARDTKELVVCFPGEHAGVIAVLAGDFSGKDLFRAIERAGASLGEKTPPVDERHGVEFMRLGRVAIARVAPNVVAIGDDMDVLATLGAATDRSASYLYAPGLVAAAQIGDDVAVRITDAGEDVALDISLRTKKSGDELESRRAGVASRIEETPLHGLGPLAANAKITVAGGRARLELRGRSADVAGALQTAAELPPNELKKMLAYVFGGADGTGTPEHKI